MSTACVGCAERRFLDALQAEAEERAAAHGRLRGPVLSTQRPWSWTLDVIAAAWEAA